MSRSGTSDAIASKKLLEVSPFVWSVFKVTQWARSLKNGRTVGYARLQLERLEREATSLRLPKDLMTFSKVFDAIASFLTLLDIKNRFPVKKCTG